MNSEDFNVKAMEVPITWARIPFDSALSSISDEGKKLKASAYLPSGPIPVIDQGVEAIGGYTDRSDLAYSGPLPVILFGDHTRRFKFVSHSFVVGAEGIKLLHPRDTFNPKFAFFALHIASIPDKGYSRHFQYLRKVTLPLPPLDEQRRIVAKLEELFSELDAGVEALRRALRRLVRYRQSLLQAAVTGELTRGWREEQTHDIELRKLDIERPDWLPLGWDWTTLGDAGEVTGGLTKNQRRHTLSMQIPYLRVANVYADDLRLEEVEKIGIQEGELRRALLQKEDLLIVEGNGSIDQIGRVAIWDGSINPCVHQNHIIKARLSERVLPRFALLWLLSPFGRDAIVDQASSTSGLHTLSISKVSSLPMPIPPMQEQQAIVAEYDRRNSLADALRASTQASLRRAERLRQSILERAFRGELVPQDPNDEPAEALLERLRHTPAESPAPRRQGRPPKVETKTPEPSSPRRRGRPRKAEKRTSGASA